MLARTTDILALARRVGPWRTWAVGAAALTLSGLAGWISAPTGREGRGDLRDSPWVLPSWSLPNVVEDLALLGRRRPFGADVSASATQVGPQAAVAPAYRIVGLVKRDGADLVVVSVEGKSQVEFHKIGDLLPDAAIIENITGTSVTVQTKAGRWIKHLFKLPDKPEL